MGLYEERPSECRVPSFIKERASEAERPSWLRRRLNSRSREKVSREDSKEESSAKVHHLLESESSLELGRLSEFVKQRSRTARELPTHLAEDGFRGKPFDYGKTEGISSEPVAAGCQAEVFAVARCNTGGEVERFAIKVLRPELAADEVEMRAFLREVNLLARLNHENVCCFVAVGTTPKGAPCVMLEWVETTVSVAMRLNEVGTVPAAKTDVRRRWPRADRLRLAAELARAICYLHARAVKQCVVVHRDLKPDNYGISADGKLKLLDLGLAACLVRDDDDGCRLSESVYKLTSHTGSLRYMAPEVGRGDRYGSSADVYSWAISTWEFLTLAGKPFAAFDVTTHRRLVIDGTTRPKIPASCEDELACLFTASWQPSHAKRPEIEHVCEVMAELLRAPRPDPPRRGCLCG